MRERGNEGQSHGPGTVLTPSPDSGKWHGGGHSKKEAGYAVGLE